MAAHAVMRRRLRQRGQALVLSALVWHIACQIGREFFLLPLNELKCGVAQLVFGLFGNCAVYETEPMHARDTHVPHARSTTKPGGKGEASLHRVPAAYVGWHSWRLWRQAARIMHSGRQHRDVKAQVVFDQPLGQLVVVVATRLHGQGQRLTCLTTAGPKCPSPISMPADSGRNARPELSNVSQPPTFGDIQSIWMAGQYAYATGVKPPAAPSDQ